MTSEHTQGSADTVLPAGRIDVRSAGSRPADEVNPAVLAAMHELDIDLTAERPKLLTDGAVREADVVIKTGDQTTPVATLKKGQFFGEMSLLTGAPRSATVQTKSPLAVTVIGKHAMSRVLSGNPGLADQFGAILTARQSELATTRETADRAARLKSGAEDGKSLTARILKFFRLSGN